jgi:iron(III) transport system substrate-binding protein
VGIDAWTSVFCINTERLEAHQLPFPMSWRDLSQPVYQGQLTMPNPLVTGTGYMVIDTILQHYGQTKGWEYLDALHQNVVQYVDASAEPCRKAGTGEIAIGVAHDLAGSLEKRKDKAIEVIFPQEGAAWDMEGNALVKKAEIKPAAKIFLDWAISDDAMQTYGRNYALTAVKTDLVLPPGLPSDPAHHLFDRDFVWGAAHRDSVLRQWQQRYNNKVVSN